MPKRTVKNQPKHAELIDKVDLGGDGEIGTLSIIINQILTEPRAALPMLLAELITMVRDYRLHDETIELCYLRSQTYREDFKRFESSIFGMPAVDAALLGLQKQEEGIDTPR